MKAEALAGSQDFQFELVHDPSEQSVIETVLEGMRAYSSPRIGIKFTNDAEVEEEKGGLKVCKAPDPKVIPNRHFWDTV